MPEAAAVAGVVLAAGSSTRLGRNKLLLALDGEPLVLRAVRAALEGSLSPVVVVLGHEAALVERELGGLPAGVRAVVNPDHARGVNTSLRAGIAALPDDVEAAVVLLADMPLVTGEMVARLVDERRRTGAPIVASAYGDSGVHAPPTLYARALFPELGGPEGDGCGKRVVREHAAETVRVAWPQERLADVDSKEDWDRMERGCVATS